MYLFEPVADKSAEIKTAKIADLIPDDRNANKGTERGDYMLTQSLQKFGAGRSILLDKSGRVIAGNKTAAKFGEVGLEDVLIVPTTGKQLVAVQRMDIDLDSPEGRELAIADNRVGQTNLDWDVEVLAELNTDFGLEDWFAADEIAAWDVPDFEPVGIEEQGRLDQRQPKEIECECPNCGSKFVRTL